MERQAKDGTVYKQVGPDDWEPVTRQAKDGTVYKKMGADAWTPLEPAKPQTGALESFGNKMGDAVTLGHGSEIGALASEYVIDPLIKKFTGLRPPEESYEQRVTDNDAQLAQMAKEHPYASGAGTVTGVLAGSMGVGSALKGAGILKNVGVVSKGVGPATRAATFGTKVANAAKEGAAYGVLADTETPVDAGMGEFIGDKAANTAISTGISAAFPVAGAALRATAKLPKKLLSSGLGVSEKNINKYLQNSERINASRPLEEIKNDVDFVIKQIQEGFESSKLSEKEARQALGAAKQRISDQAKDATKGAKDALISAKNQVDEAMASLNTSFKSEVNALKSQPAPTHLAADVVESVNNLKKMVTQGSNEAFEILEKEAKPVSFAGVPQMLDNAADALKINGKLTTPDAQKTYNFIKDFQKMLYELPPTLSGRDAKKLIQQLDEAINWGNGAGSHTPAESRALQEIRRTLDDTLKKQSPAYAAKMQEVAENTVLLKRVRKKYPDVFSANSKLAGIDGAGKGEERELLAALGSKLGQDFDGPIADYQRTRATLKDQLKLDHIKNGLPENEAVRTAEKQLAQAELKLTQTQAANSPRVLRKQLVESSEAQGVRTAREQLQAAKNEADQLGGLSENTSEGQIKSLMTGGGRNSIEAKKRMNFVGERAGKNLNQEIDDLGVKESFDKGFMNGSRNVNLGAILGATGAATGRGAIGAVVGYAGGDEVGMSTGATIGALSGALSNSYGPKMTKMILDAIIKVQKMPAAQQFKALDLPQQIKSELPQVLRRAGFGARHPETKLPNVADQEQRRKQKEIEEMKAQKDGGRNSKYDPKDLEKLRTMSPEAMEFAEGGADIGGISKIGKLGIKSAQKILKEVATPEMAAKLKGAAKELYLKALDEVYGPAAKRAEDMGFGKKTWYHGTTVPIDEFKNEVKGLSTGAQSAKKGFFFAKDPTTASQYADLASEHGIRGETVREISATRQYSNFIEKLQEKYGKRVLAFGDDVEAPNWTSKMSKSEKAQLEHLAKEKELAENAVSEAPELSYRDLDKARDAWRETKIRTGKYLAEKQQELQKNLAYWDSIKADPSKAKYVPGKYKSHDEWADDMKSRLIERFKEFYGDAKPATPKEIAEAEKQFYETAKQFATTAKDSMFNIFLETKDPIEKKLLMSAKEVGDDIAQSTGQNVLPVRLKGNPKVKNYKGQNYRDETYADLMGQATKEGKDSVLFKNTYDAADPHNKIRTDIAAVFEPNQIRSKFAAYDPRFKNSGNIMAGGIASEIDKSDKAKGPDKWASDGAAKLLKHDPELKAEIDELKKSKQGRELLIRASDLKPGSKAMDNLLKKASVK